MVKRSRKRRSTKRKFTRRRARKRRKGSKNVLPYKVMSDMIKRTVKTFENKQVFSGIDTDMVTGTMLPFRQWRVFPIDCMTSPVRRDINMTPVTGLPSTGQDWTESDQAPNSMTTGVVGQQVSLREGDSIVLKSIYHQWELLRTVGQTQLSTLQGTLIATREQPVATLGILTPVPNDVAENWDYARITQAAPIDVPLRVRMIFFATKWDYNREWEKLNYSASRTTIPPLLYTGVKTDDNEPHNAVAENILANAITMPFASMYKRKAQESGMNYKILSDKEFLYQRSGIRSGKKRYVFKSGKTIKYNTGDSEGYSIYPGNGRHYCMIYFDGIDGVSQMTNDAIRFTSTLKWTYQDD